MGASTAFPVLQLGAVPVPPDVTGCPAVDGTHSHLGVAAEAADAATQNTAIAANAIFASFPIATTFRPAPRPARGDTAQA